jgi:hypothetical protein
MKQLANNYTFDATAKTVTLNNLNIPLSQILMVAAKGKVIYSFADGLGAANYVQGENSVLTLRSTTGLTNTDKLTIFYDDVNSTYNNVYGSTLNSENNIKINNINSGWGTRIAHANIGRISLKIKSSQNVKVIFGYDLNSLKLKAGNKFIQFLEKFAIQLEANTEYSFDKEIATTGPIFAWVDEGRDPNQPSSYDSEILVQETSTLKRESDLTSIIGEIEPAVDPVLFVSTDEASLDILPENNAHYVILDTDFVNTFDMVLNGVEKVTFTDSFDANNFKNCKLTLTTTPQISANKTQVFVTESVVLSTIKNEFFTFFYYNTGSIVAGIAPSTELDPLNVPTGSVLTNVLAKEPESSLCTVTTIAGQKYGDIRFIEGNGSDAYFGYMGDAGLLVDNANDRVLVVDRANNCVRSIGLIGNSYIVNTLVGGGDPQPQPSAIPTDTTNWTQQEIDIFYHITDNSGISTADLITYFTNVNNYDPVMSQEEITNIVLILKSRGEISETNNNLSIIVKYTYPTGYMGTPNQLGGNGRSALFHYPYGLVKDSQNNFYIADTSNCIIRKITSSGVVTTYAGIPSTRASSNPPYNSDHYIDSNNKLQAKFHCPQQLAIDSSNNIYVSEAIMHTIRKINSSTGEVTTFAGSADGDYATVDGIGTAAKFKNILSMTIDKINNIMYVSTALEIRKINLETAEVTTFLNLEMDQSNAIWFFGYVVFSQTQNCLYFTANNLYNGRGIYKLSLTDNPNKIITKYAGSEINGETDGKGFECSFPDYPTSLCIDDSNGILYAPSKTCIRKITPI